MPNTSADTPALASNAVPLLAATNAATATALLIFPHITSVVPSFPGSDQLRLTPYPQGLEEIRVSDEPYHASRSYTRRKWYLGLISDRGTPRSPGAFPC